MHLKFRVVLRTQSRPQLWSYKSPHVLDPAQPPSSYPGAEVNPALTFTQLNHSTPLYPFTERSRLVSLSTQHNTTQHDMT